MRDRGRGDARGLRGARAAMVAPGRTERELQVALEAAFLRSGGDFLAFESIVAAGDHSAVLHFAPTRASWRRRARCSSTRAPSTAATRAT